MSGGKTRSNPLLFLTATLFLLGCEKIGETSPTAVDNANEREPSFATTPARPFTVAAAVGIPGFGGAGPAPCGTNPAYLNPVLLFQFRGTSLLNALPSIPPCPASLVNDPIYVAFSRRGELFVGNRHGNQSGVGSIARFVFDEDGNSIANGVIGDPSLSDVHGLAFDRTGELFAATFFNGTVARFRFDPHGAAIPNGVINVGSTTMGLAFSRHNELFVTTSSPVVLRFVFDQSGAAVPNGSFSVTGSSRLHGLAFNHQDELFLSDIDTDNIYRFRFDAAGNPVSNGSFGVAGGPIGLAFSPPDELFVSGHFGGGIQRFVFDASGTPVPNGSVATSSLGGVAVFP